LAGELDQHLANDTAPNHKNGSTRNTVKTSSGQFERDTQRDRNGYFEQTSGANSLTKDAKHASLQSPIQKSYTYSTKSYDLSSQGKNALQGR
jgi:transposase-like protein